jgi:hypothetical protein
MQIKFHNERLTTPKATITKLKNSTTKHNPASKDTKKGNIESFHFNFHLPYIICIQLTIDLSDIYPHK